MKLGVYFPARGGHEGGRALPAPDAFAAIGFPFQQVDSGPKDVNLVPDPEPPLEALDQALVLVLDHQEFTHIYLIIYLQVYHLDGFRQSPEQMCKCDCDL